MNIELIPGAHLVLSSLAESRLANGFRERVLIAAGYSGVPRTIAQPYYLSDLGVRQFRDPEIFFAANTESLRRSEMIDRDEVASVLIECEIESLADRLDALILLTGDYSTARRVVQAREPQILGSGDALLQIYSGVLSASEGSETCRAYFTRAAQSDNPITRFTSWHRLAASEIKRLGHPERAFCILHHAEASLSATSSILITASDRRALASIAANLRALAMLELGRTHDAEVEMSAAKRLITMVGLGAVKDTESARYAAQENINSAQLILKRDGIARALPVLEKNVEFCLRHAQEYVGEASAALAYGLFLAGRYEEAVRRSLDSVLLIAEEASPLRLRSAREILAASLFASGDDATAAEVLDAIEVDPVGIDLMTAESRRGES